MKKYTLEQLKTEKIVINVRTKKEAKSLLQKFDEIGLSGGNRDVDYMFGQYKNQLCFSASATSVSWGTASFFHNDGFTIITPDQIDWGEEEKKGIYHTERSIVLREYMPLPYSGPKQSKTPAVFIKAQKDWNGFKTFLKEIEAYGRGLTSSQLKTFMAKVRKDMKGGK